MKARIFNVIFLVIAFFASPVFAQLSGTDYGYGSVRTQQNVVEGVVVDVVASRVTQDASPTSRVVGGALGVATCATALRNNSNWLLKTAAMTTCGVVGERIGNHVGTTNSGAQTFIVKTSTGQTLAVTQGDPDIVVGQRVYVLTGQGMRVVKAST